VVIDTGPSRRFGEQERALIEQSTGKKVIRVYLTHHHPDHFFGNQAFSDLPIYALPATTQGIKQEGESFSNNMYRMIGDWMRDTSVVPPNQVAQVGKETIGGHELELLAFKGHTHGDLAIFDHTTGVLFTGDLVFNQRAATTPHANVIDWLASLEQLLNIPFKVLVPGHGSITQDDQAIAQTRAYLVWLETILQQAAMNGLDMNEVMMTPIPADFKDVALAQSELRRSVAHLYPALEAEQLKPAKQAE
ncbi:MAG: quinoprotein relay system zinc metallohydrolase 1, partial [Thiothrix sp.]